jgi:hypothetical protein
VEYVVSPCVLINRMMGFIYGYIYLFSLNVDGFGFFP